MSSRPGWSAWTACGWPPVATSTTTGELTGRNVVHLDEDGRAGSWSAPLEGAGRRSAASRSKPYRRRPAAPFTTSTLQQEAGRKLRFSARQAMRVAQSLYENGYITYMRTDSTTLSRRR